MSSNSYAEEIQHHLVSRRRDVTVLALEETDSTNDEARDLAEKGFPEGTLVVAKRQRRGRGRMGRRWTSPEGGVFMSIVLRPPRHLPGLSALPLVVGYGVARALREEYDVPAMIKWPNDVLVRGRKIAGILCESALGQTNCWVVAGIGINATMTSQDFPQEIQGLATSLFLETGIPVSIPALIASVHDRVMQSYSAFLDRGFAALLPTILQISAYVGGSVTVSTPAGPLVGKMLGIDQEGLLLLELPNNDVRRIPAGDVSLRKS
ncbi:MAG TPA: biotin--[acetyl-CoA-carboxylase] ligase [Firmicutes bacterium]|nr:biotin--[acetyl-CoA-carboxylase] ligase [Candidatus Fermentithermobacillaceae bacterium]